MTPFLTGFAAELVKLGETKDPTAKANGKMEKLLRGGLSKYVGEKDVRNPTFPSMEQVSNQSFKDKGPSIDLRPLKAPKV